MAKRQFKEASHIQVRRINRQWCVVSYFNTNYYHPICTGCIACKSELGISRDWECNPNRLVKMKSVDIISECSSRSAANSEADVISEDEWHSEIIWSGAWDYV